METSDNHPKAWNSFQAYGLAVICLLLGTAVGYLLHGPTVANPGRTEAAAAPVSGPASTAPEVPSAADLKRMADTQVAPMLEELRKHPNDADLLEKIGHSYMAAQQFLSAQQYLEQSVAAKPKADTLNELSFVYLKLGDVDKAIGALQHALALEPKNPNALFNLGVYEWLGKMDAKAAIAAWQTLLKDDPQNPKRAEIEKMMAQAKKHLSIPPGTKTDKPAS
jgi:cytochrome c-type biogenesis protein CcmH/NrfG